MKNNLKKFCAFALATAMVAGAVYYVTPAMKAFADTYSGNRYTYKDGSYTQYVEGELWWDGHGYVDYDHQDEVTSRKVTFDPGVGKGEALTQYTPDGTTLTIPKCTFEKPDGWDDFYAWASDGDEVLDTEIYYREDQTSHAITKDTTFTAIWSRTKNESTPCDPEHHWRYIINSEYEVVGKTSPELCSWGEDGKCKVCGQDKTNSGPIIKTEELTLDKSTDTIEEGKTTTLKATVIPSEAEVTWSSSDKSIATVDDKGTVTGVKAGKVTITATAADINKTAKCEITVTAKATTVIPEEASKQNATSSGSSSSSPELSSEAQANYEQWLATWGGGTTTGDKVVEGTIGEPGSEVILNNTGMGAPVTMFQSTDTSQTLVAGLDGAIPTGTKFTTIVAPANSADFKAAQTAIRKLSRRGNVAMVIGVSATTKDGIQLTTLGGKAAISIPLDSEIPNGRHLQAYAVDGGKAEKLDTAVDKGRAVLGTQKLGTFGFVIE